VAAQPFAHLGVPNAARYRRLLRVFARAKERFIVHLRPEDIAAELRDRWRGDIGGSRCDPQVSTVMARFP
jgi:hypothetical protein